MKKVLLSAILCSIALFSCAVWATTISVSSTTGNTDSKFFTLKSDCMVNWSCNLTGGLFGTAYCSPAYFKVMDGSAVIVNVNTKITNSGSFVGIAGHNYTVSIYGGAQGGPYVTVYYGTATGSVTYNETEDVNQRNYNVSSTDGRASISTFTLAGKIMVNWKADLSNGIFGAGAGQAYFKIMKDNTVVMVSYSERSVFSGSFIGESGTYSVEICGGGISTSSGWLYGNVSGSVSYNVSIPTLSVNLPPNGSYIKGNLNILATASSNGGIKDVKLFINDVCKATATTPPYSFNLDSTGLGKTSIKVVATNSYTNLAEASTNVTFDNQPPAVAIIKPANGAVLGSATSIDFNASDNTGFKYINLFIDGKVINTYYPSSGTYTGSYLFNATDYSNGTHTIVLEAQDLVGTINTSTITVTVHNPLKINEVQPLTPLYP